MAYSKPFNGDFKITSGFGPRGGKNHDGIDFACPRNTPIFAIESGRVTVSQLDQYGANWLDILLDNGLVVRYLHFTRILLKVGQRVTSGQLVGYSGGIPGEYGSGLSTGAHLHLGISRAGRFFNWYPEIWPLMNNFSAGVSNNPVVKSTSIPLTTDSYNSLVQVAGQQIADNLKLWEKYNDWNSAGLQIRNDWLVVQDRDRVISSLNNIFGQITPEQWQSLESQSDAMHLDHIQRLFETKNLSQLINDYILRCQERNQYKKDVEIWQTKPLEAVLDYNRGDGWKEQNLKDNELDLAQAVDRNDLGFILENNISLRRQIASSPAKQDYLDLKNQLEDTRLLLDQAQAELARIRQSAPAIPAIPQDKFTNSLEPFSAETNSISLSEAKNTNSSDKPFYASKKWLVGFINTVFSTGILALQTIEISGDDNWQTVALKLGSAVATILGINFVSSSYITGQSKVDAANVKNT